MPLTRLKWSVKRSSSRRSQGKNNQLSNKKYFFCSLNNSGDIGFAKNYPHLLFSSSLACKLQSWQFYQVGIMQMEYHKSSYIPKVWRRYFEFITCNLPLPYRNRICKVWLPDCWIPLAIRWLILWTVRHWDWVGPTKLACLKG